MGRVFTFEEVKASRTPGLSAFDEVAAESCRLLVPAKRVVCALFCGSVVSGSVTVRSDFDMVAVYLGKKQPSEFQQLHEFAAARHVPLELIPIDKRVAGRADATMVTPFFWCHLKLAARKGGVIKGDPLSWIVPRAGIEDEQGEYADIKIARLEKWWPALGVMSEAELCRALQKALEAPVHAARKFVIERSGELELQDDSKSWVIEGFRQHATRKEQGLLGRAMKPDESYSLALDEQLRNPDELSYRHMVRKTAEEAFPVTLELLKSLAAV